MYFARLRLNIFDIIQLLINDENRHFKLIPLLNLKVTSSIFSQIVFIVLHPIIKEQVTKTSNPNGAIMTSQSAIFQQFKPLLNGVPIKISFAASYRRHDPLKHI